MKEKSHFWGGEEKCEQMTWGVRLQVRSGTSTVATKEGSYSRFGEHLPPC